MCYKNLYRASRNRNTPIDYYVMSEPVFFISYSNYRSTDTKGPNNLASKRHMSFLSQTPNKDLKLVLFYVQETVRKLS